MQIHFSNFAEKRAGRQHHGAKLKYRGRRGWLTHVTLTFADEKHKYKKKTTNTATGETSQEHQNTNIRKLKTQKIQFNAQGKEVTSTHVTQKFSLALHRRLTKNNYVKKIATFEMI